MDIRAVARSRSLRVGTALGLLCLAVVLPASAIEQGFSRGYFPWIQAVLVPLSGVVPFPVMGTALVLLPFALLVFARRRWRAARRRGATRRALWGAGALRALRWTLYLAALFLLLWGYGYRRVPIEDRWQLGGEPLGQDQVREVQARLLALIHRDCPPAGAVAAEVEAAALASLRRSEVEWVRRTEGWTPAMPRRVKHPPGGLLMAVGIYGIVSPFTLEAHVEPALPPPMRVGIAAHELAHLLGYNGEADANLFGFVAGLNADHPFARYGTALSMLRYAISLQHLKDARWLLDNLPPRARDDLTAVRTARRKHRVESLSRVSHAMNDRYLRSVGVKLGVEDYSRGFTLFVRAVGKGMVGLPAAYRPAEAGGGAGAADPGKDREPR